MKGIKILLALALISAAASATAEIYTWKDANGRVHFSDSPPPDANVKPIKNTPTTPTPEADASKPAPKSWQEKEQESRQKKAEQAQTEEKKKAEQARAAEKEAYCANLRRNLAMLERGGRVGHPNDKGEFEFYSDDQLAKETEQARSKLARECK